MEKFQTVLLVYVCISSMMLLYVATIFSKNGYVNVILKTMFSLAAFIGCFISMKLLGWL